MSKKILALALAVLVSAAGAAFAKERFKFEVTVTDAEQAPMAGASVSLTAASGEPFTVSGVTDKKGRFKGELPDFARVYVLKVGKEGYAAREESVDLPAQKLKSSMTAELGLALVPRDHVTIYNEGVQALQLHDTETAIARFEEAAAGKPDFKEAWRALASLYDMQKDYERSLEAAAKVLAIDPADVEALRSRFDSLEALGRREESAAALEQLAALDRTPDTAKLLYNAGAEAWNSQHGDLARKRFAQALEIDPKLYQAHSALAEIHVAGQEYAEAVAELDRALTITPRNFRAYERKIEILKAMGKTAEAAEVEKALAELRGGS